MVQDFLKLKMPLLPHYRAIAVFIKGRLAMLGLSFLRSWLSWHSPPTPAAHITASLPPVTVHLLYLNGYYQSINDGVGKKTGTNYGKVRFKTIGALMLSGLIIKYHLGIKRIESRCAVTTSVIHHFLK
jgi:hypothetical protein